jgi:hypothetical protein
MSSAVCAQVNVAAWLVLLAHEQREMELVRSTISSLLATSRWELLNAGRGIVMHEVVFDLLKRLAAHSLAAAGSRNERGSDSSTGSNMSVSEPAATRQLQLPQVMTSPSAAGAGEVVGTAVAGAEAGSGSTGARLSSLGSELLQPQLLGQLLHVSQGLSPWRLLTVVELVDWWGLGSTPQQQQQQVLQQEAQPMPQPSAAQVEEQVQQQQQPLPQAIAVAPVSPTVQAGNEPQQMQHAAQRQSSSVDSAAMRMVVLRSSSGASLSSDGAGNDDSSVASSSSDGSGDAACDVLSPCGAGPQADAGAGRPPGAVRLVAANSVEVGSLQSDDCQQANTWLDDLISKGPHSRNAAATNSTAGGAAASPTIQQQQQAPSQAQQVFAEQQQQQQQLPMQQPVHAVQPCAHGEPKHLDLGKEWGGSWQQLTGQVAQLHMTSPGTRQQQQQQQQQCGSPPLRSPMHSSAPLRQPRCSFDYEQHVAQQLRRRQLQQGQDEPVRRGSSPGRYPSSVAAARQLRSSLSQPAAPRCPVHPYMQQSSGRQHQHEP